MWNIPWNITQPEKRDEMKAICSDKHELEITMLSRGSQKEEDKHQGYHLYVESKYSTIEPIYKTETDP